jgi:DNA-3-methyladenine glycosylase II
VDNRGRRTSPRVGRGSGRTRRAVGRFWYSFGMTTFELVPAGPFSLGASAAFLEGFSPAAHGSAEDGHLHLAFVPDGEEAAAGVCLRQPDGVVVGEVFGGTHPDGVREQVARILSLDVDGSGFPEVGRRDPVVGGLQRRWPGLRPVGFFSPYEAAAWALIGHRTRIVQAARIKQGAEAIEGRLDGARLRGLPRDQASGS